MSILLSNLRRRSLEKKRKRVGRGNASGQGTYAGRGLKGQRSRSGGRRGLRLMGLKQTLKNIPKKRGFRGIYPKMALVNLNDLNKHFKEGEEVSFKKLIDRKIVKFSPSGLKILGQGELSKKLIVKAHRFSKKAKESIVKMGGQAKEI